MKYFGLGLLLSILVACDGGVPSSPRPPLIALDASEPVDAFVDAGVDAASPECGDGRLDTGEQCDDGNTVDADGCSSECTLEVCGDGQLTVGEGCDDGNQRSGDGCSADCRVEVCGDGELAVGEECDDGNQLDGDGCDAACRTERCGNGRLDVGEACDDGNARSGDGCDAVCREEVCGDGVVSTGESCDDGNTTPGDGCNATCQAEICGNAVEDAGEQCDDGGRVGGDGCSADCRLEACGNGIVDVGEQCDDGNLEEGDGCAPTCVLEVCGNGIVDAGEACDDGGRVAGDGCDPDCRVEVCGNNIVDVGEECDDGALEVGDGCDAFCRREVCGNGIVDAGEACDDGNVAPADGCSATCTIEACGDGLREPHEECDDGNQNSGDGCSAQCSEEICGNNIVDASEACDDGNLIAGDGCDAECRVEACGNGRVDGPETCDDGNQAPGDGCSAVCQIEICGNGALDPNEACDDGNLDGGDGCDPTCRTEVCGDGILQEGEGCDDGNLAAGDGCSAACSVEVCGNGVVDFGEECDDGNVRPFDGCSVDCHVEPCGDGLVGPGEGCDDGNLVAGDGCNPLCQVEQCGNGRLDFGEECDDGEDNRPDLCHRCRLRIYAGCSDACDQDGTLGAARDVQWIPGGPAIDLRDGTAVIATGQRIEVYRDMPDAWGLVGTVEGIPRSGLGTQVATHGGRITTSQCGGQAFPEVFWQDAAGDWASQLLQGVEFGRGYGCSLDIYVDTVAVGAHAPDTPEDPGSVYLFAPQAHDEWQLIERLTLPEGDGDERFGESLSLDADTLVVGAPGQDAAVERSGAVHVFERVDGAWRATQVLTPGDGAAGSGFGQVVDLRGDLLAIGAPDRDGTGAVYVFSRREGAWRQTARVDLPRDPNDRFAPVDFGADVRIGAGVILASALRRSAFDGTAEIHAFTFDLADGWIHRRMIEVGTVPLNRARSRFAFDTHTLMFSAGDRTSLRILDIPVCHFDGECACVDGAGGVGCAARPRCGDGQLQLAEHCDDGDNDPGDGCQGCQIEVGWECETPGAACTSICGDGLQVGFEVCDDGNQIMLDGCGPCTALLPAFCECDAAGALGWLERETVEIPALQRLGFNAAVIDDTVAIGMPGMGQGGQVGVLEHDGVGWRQTQTLVSEVPGDFFGWSVEIGQRWLMASSAGRQRGEPDAAHFFERDAQGAWALAQVVELPPVSQLGSSFALEGDWAFASVSKETLLALVDNPRVLVLRHDGVRWSVHQEIPVLGEPEWSPPRPIVAAHGEHLWVGGYDPQNTDGGVVRTYRLQGEEWVPQQTFRPDASGPQGRFGFALDVSAHWAMVGAPEMGTVFVYRLGADGEWAQTQTLRRPVWEADGDDFGRTIALHGARAVVDEIHYVLDASEAWLPVEVAGEGAGLSDRFIAWRSSNPRGVSILDTTHNEPWCTVGRTCLCVSGAAGEDCAERSGCGNGRVDAVEQCDDGNRDDGDGCSATCELECGDGVTTGAETCDDGGRLPGDGCGSTCQIEACGNAIVDPGEACDDGNLQAGDRCDAECRIERCGNGRVDAGEGCDDGNLRAGDGCSVRCTPEVCGNGILDPGEICDDGNVIAGDGCASDCAGGRCGDGVLDAGEDCDDANDDRLDGCDGCRLRTASRCAAACDPLGTVGVRAPTLTAATAYLDENFGRHLAVNDGIAVVGRGVDADLYLQDADARWVRTQSLITNPAIVDGAGLRVALRPGAVALGSAFHSSVQIFTPDADGLWQSAQTLPFEARSGFGTAMAMDLRTLVVGAPNASRGRGAAVFFEEQEDGAWIESVRVEGLENSSEAGDAVALRGRWALVGMPFDDALAFNAGRVMVLHRDAQGAWVRHQVLAAPVPALGAQFGRHLAMNSTHLAIGSTRAVHLFRLGADGQWVLAQEHATATDGALAFVGDRLLIGNADSNQIDRLQQTGADEWVVDAPLSAPLPNDAGFGAQLVAYGNMVLATASETPNERGRAGVVHFLDVREPTCFDDGRCVCLEGAGGPTCSEHVACGDGVLQVAEGCDDGGRDPGDGCNATCRTELGWRCDAGACTPICGDGLLRGGEVCDDGNSDALDACNACQPQGADRCDAACAIDGTEAIWEASVVDSDRPVVGDALGDTIALDGSTLIASTARNAAGEPEFGIVVFERVDGVFVEVERLEPLDGPIHGFGETIVVNERWLVVGAPEYRNASGVVFVFERGEGGWQQRQVIESTNIEVGARFGHSVALRGERLVINSLRGASHAYRSSPEGWRLEYRRGGLDGSLDNVVLDDAFVYLGESAHGRILIYPHDVFLNAPEQVIHKPEKRLFGSSIALSGDSMLVGGAVDAYTLGPGQLFAYQRDVDGVWVETQRIDSPERRFSWTFGSAVAINEETAWAISRNEELQRAVVYRLQRDAAEQWRIVQRWPIEGGLFSRTIAQSGDAVAVGVPQSADAPGLLWEFAPSPLCDAAGACVCREPGGGERCVEALD